jgi:hypothetical protein
MSLSYLLNKSIGIKNYSLPLIFAASIAPDLDFLFYSLPHHTITHSITFWTLFYVPFAIVKGRKILPYVLATFSHFLVGDLITGNPPLFYGLSDQKFGFIRPLIVETWGSIYGTLFQAIVDVIMVVVFLLMVMRYKDLHGAFSSHYNIKHILILGFVVFLIFIGAYTGDIVYVLKDNKDLLYLSYGITAISNLSFLLILLRGNNRPLDKSPD